MAKLSLLGAVHEAHLTDQQRSRLDGAYLSHSNAVYFGTLTTKESRFGLDIKTNEFTARVSAGTVFLELAREVAKEHPDTSRRLMDLAKVEREEATGLFELFRSTLMEMRRTEICHESSIQEKNPPIPVQGPISANQAA
jgi:hypothetical protein